MSHALIPPPSIGTRTPEAAPSLRRRSVTKLLAPLEQLAEHSRHLLSRSLGHFSSQGGDYALPRYLFVGPKGGGETLRIGLFATIHGDEPEGAVALTRLLHALEANPEPARGYALFVYPVCNPTGYEDDTRAARSGRDLNQEFWRESDQPEVRFLESEIWMQGFHGIISLHSDPDSSGIYGFVQGDILSESLLEPALQSASVHVPRNHHPVIHGLPARHGIIRHGYPGILQSVPGMKHPPFELTIESPRQALIEAQALAQASAVARVLAEFRVLQALAQHI